MKNDFTESPTETFEVVIPRELIDGYPTNLSLIDGKRPITPALQEWLDDLGRYEIVRGKIVFENLADATLFKLRWIA